MHENLQLNGASQRLSHEIQMLVSKKIKFRQLVRQIRKLFYFLVE